MRLSPQMIPPPAQHCGCIFLHKNIMVAWVARKKSNICAINLQSDNLIYGDGTQPSLRLRLPTSSSRHHKNPLVIAKN
jgi:hypothetical protein